MNQGFSGGRGRTRTCDLRRVKHKMTFQSFHPVLTFLLVSNILGNLLSLSR